jgi:hypothetical protein
MPNAYDDLFGAWRQCQIARRHEQSIAKRRVNVTNEQRRCAAHPSATAAKSAPCCAMSRLAIADSVDSVVCDTVCATSPLSALHNPTEWPQPLSTNRMPNHGATTRTKQRGTHDSFNVRDARLHDRESTVSHAPNKNVAVVCSDFFRNRRRRIRSRFRQLHIFFFFFL